MEDSEGGGVSAEAIERLREQMKKASGAIKAIKREEGKQKKKESKLAELLVKLIQGGAKQDILALIIQLLAENIPASFILAILILTNEEIKKEAANELKLDKYDDPEKKMLRGEDVELTREEKKIFKKKAEEMQDLKEDEELPEKLMEAINEWAEMMLAAGLSTPHKVTATVLDEEKKIKAPVVQLTTFILRDYFEEHGIDHKYEDLWEFCAAILRSIMTKLNRVSRQLPKEKLPELEAGDERVD